MSPATSSSACWRVHSAISRASRGNWVGIAAAVRRAREVAKRGAIDPELVMARDEAARLGEALKEMAVKVTGRWG